MILLANTVFLLERVLLEQDVLIGHLQIFVLEVLARELGDVEAFLRRPLVQHILFYIE